MPSTSEHTAEHITSPSMSTKADANSWEQENSTTTMSEQDIADTFPRIFATIEPVTQHPLSIIDQTNPKPSISFSNAEKPHALDTINLVPLPEPVNQVKEATVQAATPTTPEPRFDDTHVRSVPIFDPAELQSVFLTELPPRPPPRRNSFVRLFKRRAHRTEDIECQTYPASGQTASDSREVALGKKARSPNVIRATAAIAGFSGLIALFLVAVSQGLGGPRLDGKDD
ncbi:hypothetical protein EK21DRAFT_108380 [Setomelanomma holmii]|uniref:Uncharacterized protein n=1 Tax=Setomelanomma holmii TaxID=210430 RepID=A0A9P4HGR8_9PLEO|nr:hypothetical protein EK21DRAFT_108380 [Setomelanomma holmii]